MICIQNKRNTYKCIAHIVYYAHSRATMRRVHGDEKMVKLKLVFYGSVAELKDKELELEGNPLVVPFPAPAESTKDFIAIFEVKA